MENKHRGYHVTIVNNNTGETLMDADTRESCTRCYTTRRKAGKWSRNRDRILLLR